MSLSMTFARGAGCVLLLAGLVQGAGEPPPLVKETDLHKLAVDILEAHISKELLSPDGKWSPLDIEDAEKEFQQKAKGKAFKVVVATKVEKIETVQVDGKPMIHLTGSLIHQKGFVKFRGQAVDFNLGPAVNELPVYLFPLSEKAKFQKAKAGQTFLVEVTATPLFFDGNGKRLLLQIPKGRYKLLYFLPDESCRGQCEEIGKRHIRVDAIPAGRT